ncbi:WASH complex subunit 2 [Orussus abietinus]|uniref:WASH complex subunit 2 n=1 Tax=Orussus abietinus TaxID=222816 RepID=UPI0006256500|nr:WASH complex subunit 2 [Orussus abietinus]
MDVPTGTDEVDKSWDHAWSTDEIRSKRREWSLAGDAGLLKHLQQFSQNLIFKANKTQETLNSLTTQLDETALFIDNVTNTSLALANTQFIESRVSEDDVEMEKPKAGEHQKAKNEQTTADLIATVNESLLQGLEVLDKKFERLEIVPSDSEDEGDDVIPSIILRPKNPYEDRPLPYVIGSEKWKASNKVGLESSSSESEQAEEEEESESNYDDEEEESVMNSSNLHKSLIAKLSSASSESNDFNVDSNSVKHLSQGQLQPEVNDKHDSDSETSAITNGPPKILGSKNEAPSFADELAKRLGKVMPTQDLQNIKEAAESSINRSKDELFTPEDEEDIFSTKSKNLFSGGKGLFDDELSNSLWKNAPLNTPKTNIIPPSIDVPPPMSSVSSKPKSEIDDLFGDADSEDSDDIFSSKHSTKIQKQIPTRDHASATNSGKKWLGIAAMDGSSLTTSTPETENVKDSFGAEADEDDLFNEAKCENKRTAEITPTESNKTQRKKPVAGVSIFGDTNIASDFEKKLQSMMPRRQSSDSSGEVTPSNVSQSGNATNSGDNMLNARINENLSEISSIAVGGHVHRLAEHVESSDSSGISSQPSSINITFGSGFGADFHPVVTSTRLKSEEIFRERVVSDSLFEGPSRRRGSNNSAGNSNRPREERIEEVSDRQSDVFENDLFGPPPLPKSGDKSKSKVVSLFDNSDSGDELFSNTSSGSRSQKSADFLVATPHSLEKSKPPQRKGLFDDEFDIFGSKDSPDVDIFGRKSRESIPRDEKPPPLKTLGTSATSDNKMSAEVADSRDPKVGVDKSSASRSLNTRVTQKSSIFDQSDEEDDNDLFGSNFGSKPAKSETTTKQNLFSSDEDDLFGTPPALKEKSTEPQNASEPPKEAVKKSNDGKKVNDTEEVFTGESAAPSSSRDRLFDDIPDDDDDDLFAEKKQTRKVSQKEDVGTKMGIAEKSGDFAESVAEVQGKDDEKLSSDSEMKSDHPVDSVDKVSREPDARGSRIADSEEVDFKRDDFFNSTNVRKDPPKSLNIRPSVSVASEGTAPVPRRSVSVKIKNLMGKMSDLKILSPTDTPPSWKKGEETSDESNETTDRDSEDGGCVSLPSDRSPPESSEDCASQKQSSEVAVPGSRDTEVAVSFDGPIQIETLSATVSKSRARIQAKRRPQSRHARQSALRHSGIDFDTVDTTTGNILEVDRSELITSVHTSTVERTTTERLFVPGSIEGSNRTATDSNSSYHGDDKSELSISKESSMSINKNTLLSPSTDEEDLFDVPPDLPEDPQKEDLFGRAPLLSPIENIGIIKKRSNVEIFRDTSIRSGESKQSFVNVETRQTYKISAEEISTKEDVTSDGSTLIEDENVKEKTKDRSYVRETRDSIIIQESHAETREETQTESEPIDPLRDDNHDPLKDPSQLFAFVTKTPSPEKGKTLLFHEDDSLFSTVPKISSTESKIGTLDLFADDGDGDLFSTPVAKQAKPISKEKKLSLFGDDDDDDDDTDNLFRSFSKKVVDAEEDTKVKSSPAQESAKKDKGFDVTVEVKKSKEVVAEDTSGNFNKDKDKDLFSTVNKTKKMPKEDIFGGESSEEDDLFAVKKTIKKPVQASSLFPDDEDDDGDIFMKGNVSTGLASTSETRAVIKKSVTKDLKKTAGKIAEDPLSSLQDD